MRSRLNRRAFYRQDCGPLALSRVLARRVMRGVLLTAASVLFSSAGCEQNSTTQQTSAPPLPDVHAAEQAVVAFIQLKHAALSEAPGDASAWGEYAIALHAHGFLREAIIAYDEAAKRVPNEFRWVYLAAIASDEIGDACTNARLQQARVLRNDYLPMRLREVEELLASNPESARKLLMEIDANPHDEVILNRLRGEAALNAGDANDSIALLERSRAAGVTDRRLWSALARAYRLANRNDEAAHAAAMARAAPPEASIADPLLAEVQSQNQSVTAMIERSERMRNAGNPEKALALLENAAKRTPENAIIHAAIARLLATAGRFDEALAAIDRALQLSATFPDGQLLRARILLSLDRFDEATEDIQAALNRSPRDAQWHELREEAALRRADHFLAKRNLAEAARVLHEHLQWRPTSARTAIRLAQIRNAQQDAPAAIEVLDNALRANDEDVLLRTALAWQLATNPDDRVRDGARAIALIEPMVGPGRQVAADTLEALAAAYAESGRFAEALEVIATLESAFSQEPLTSPITVRLRQFRKMYANQRPFRDAPAPKSAP